MAVAIKQDQWEALNVSRETLDRLTVYSELLVKWQKKINLVGPKTIDDLWTRHFLDSAQLYAQLPADTHKMIDLGCGAGFPGLVLAIMGVSDVHLVDSDHRKMAFVREAARLTETPVTLHIQRLEQVDLPGQFDVVTSRALAGLTDLLDPALHFLKPDGVGLFLKGRQSDVELEEAMQSWAFDVETVQSLSDPSGHILKIERIQRK